MKNIKYNLDKKTRIDKYLSTTFPDISRTIWQKAIKNGEILINDTKITPHYSLTDGDNICINLIEKEKPIAKNWQIPIIAETEDYLVVDKPAGIVVHPAKDFDDTTLIDVILKTHPKIKEIGDNTIRPGIVHRLDKNVSGLMIIAKTEQMFFALKEQFKTKKTKKIYLGLVYGLIKDDYGKIDFNIARSENGKMVARPTNQEGKKALTEYEVINRYNNFSYLKINIKTGRTHQIRLHFHALGFPIVGEKLHLQKKLKSNLKLDRMFLHAHILGFYNLQNEWQEFTSPLPLELKKVLDKIK